MSENQITRSYATLPVSTQDANLSWQIHYREAGSGAPVVLLHPSPLSSEFMEPLLDRFSKHSRSIAWDTPGYGQSDALTQPKPGLKPYASALHQFMQHMELEKPILYGSATGAQIAIEYSLAFPEAVRGLILENVAWFYEEERDAIMASYFPSLKPKTDGSHLQIAWQMSDQLYRYFPWYHKSERSRISDEGAPLEVVHQTALHYLISGENYDTAYRAAFLNEKPEPIQALRVPTRILLWSGSLLDKYSNRLNQVKLPDNVTLHRAGKSSKERFLILENTLRELL